MYSLALSIRWNMYSNEAATISMDDASLSGKKSYAHTRSNKLNFSNKRNSIDDSNMGISFVNKVFDCLHADDSCKPYFVLLPERKKENDNDQRKREMHGNMYKIFAYSDEYCLSDDLFLFELYSLHGSRQQLPRGESLEVMAN